MKKKDGRLFKTHSLTISRFPLVAEAEAEMTQPEVVISNKLLLILRALCKTFFTILQAVCKKKVVPVVQNL